MIHQKVDTSHSQLPREDQTPGPGGARVPPAPCLPSPQARPLPVEPCQQGLLLSPLAPGRDLRFIILSLGPSLPLPWAPLRGDTQEHVESLSPGGRQLWPLWGRGAQVSGLPWQHHRPCPRGRWVPGRGPCPASRGPPHPAPACIPSLAHQTLL